jgi:hypothetical protein
VVFAATTNRHEAARAEVDLSLWLVSLAGGEPRRLTGDEGDYASPDFTPDGSTLLAKVQPAAKKYVYTASRLARWSWPSLADRRVLTADIDVSVGDYSAAPDNRRVFFLAERDGHYQTFPGSPASKGQLQFDMWGKKPASGFQAPPKTSQCAHTRPARNKPNCRATGRRPWSPSPGRRR